MVVVFSQQHLPLVVCEVISLCDWQCVPMKYCGCRGCSEVISYCVLFLVYPPTVCQSSKLAEVIWSLSDRWSDAVRKSSTPSECPG